MIVSSVLLAAGLGAASSSAEEDLLPGPPPMQSLHYRTTTKCGSAGGDYDRYAYGGSDTEYAGDLSEAKLSYEYTPSTPNLWTVWQWKKFSGVAERYEAKHTDRLEGDILMPGDKIKVLRIQEHETENTFQPFRSYYPASGTGAKPIGNREIVRAEADIQQGNIVEGYSGLSGKGTRTEWWVVKTGDSWLPYELRVASGAGNECITRIYDIQINKPITGKPFLQLDDPKVELLGQETAQGIPNAPIPETLHFVETSTFGANGDKEIKIVDGDGVHLRTEIKKQNRLTGWISHLYVTLITPEGAYMLRPDKKTGERTQLQRPGAFGDWEYLQGYIDDYYPGEQHGRASGREWLKVRHVGTEEFEGREVEAFESSGNWNGEEGQAYRKRWLLTHQSGWWLPVQYQFDIKGRNELTRIDDVRINEPIDSTLFEIPKGYTITDK